MISRIIAKLGQWWSARAKRKEDRKAAAERIEKDEYLSRLRNSACDLSGLRHSWGGSDKRKHLTIPEVRAILFDVLEAAEEDSRNG